MNWEQLREIVSMGHEVQSHGWSHKYLSHCSGPELATELERSKKRLEDGLGARVEALAAPGGAWNTRVAEACARAGYKRFYITDPWFGTRERSGLKIIGRMMVNRTLDPAGLQRLLDAEGRRFSMLRTTFRLKQTVRAVLGDRTYHRLWLWLAHAGDEVKAESYF
jgi:peptidoglycan/xylan/chitin deacetylase (PgdA/CDA1 family)